MEEYIDGETSPFLREDFLKSAHKKSGVHAQLCTYPPRTTVSP